MAIIADAVVILTWHTEIVVAPMDIRRADVAARAVVKIQTAEIASEDLLLLR